MTLLEAQKLTLSILKQVMEEKLDQHNVQLAHVRILKPSVACQTNATQITQEGGFEILSELKLQEVIDQM